MTTDMSSTQIESPEELLSQRLLFISELLTVFQDTIEYKDQQERALEFAHEILKSLEEDVLQGFFEAELLSIR